MAALGSVRYAFIGEHTHFKDSYAAVHIPLLCKMIPCELGLTVVRVVQEMYMMDSKYFHHIF